MSMFKTPSEWTVTDDLYDEKGNHVPQQKKVAVPHSTRRSMLMLDMMTILLAVGIVGCVVGLVVL